MYLYLLLLLLTLHVHTAAVELGPASLFGSTYVGTGKPFSDTQAKWIWIHAGTASTSTVMAATFSTTLFAAVQGTQVVLTVIVDDDATVYLNGDAVGDAYLGWYGDIPPTTIRLTLAKGINTLSIRAHNDGGPAGLLASVASADGKTVLARTSSAWTYTVDAQGAPGTCADS